MYIRRKKIKTKSLPIGDNSRPLGRDKIELGRGSGIVHSDNRINDIELITRQPVSLSNYERLKSIESSLLADNPANSGQVSFYRKLYEDDLKSKGLL